MRKLFTSLILIIIIFSIFTSPTFAAEKIQSFNLEVKINQDGTADLKETINYDFGQTPKHGIFRKFSLIRENDNKEKFILDFQLKDITNQQDKPQTFQNNSDNQEVNLKIGDPNKTVVGLNTYVLEYKISGTINYLSDHDEFYWNVNGFDWEIPIDKITATITLPESVSSDDIYLKCFTGTFGSKEQKCSFSKKDNVSFFETSASLPAGQNLSIVVGFPHGIVSELNPTPQGNSPQKPSFLSTILGILLTIGYIIFYWILPIFVLINWFIRGRDPKVNPGPTAWFEPPKHGNRTVMTPSDVGLLTDESIDARDISATIVSLAIKGFLRIEKIKDNDYKFIKTQPKKNEPLNSFEEKIYKGIFENEKTEATTKSLKDNFYKEVKTAKDSLYDEMTKQGYFDKNPQTVRTTYLILGIISLFILNIFLGIVLLIISRFMPRKTKLGTEKREEALSLKRFLISQERQLTFQEKNWYFFEKLLPYAISFGVAKVWAEKFKDMQIPEDISWYKGDSQALAIIPFTNSISSFAKSAETMSGVPYSSSRSSSGFSSGFSSGGGFSGGGGGGGGGGSW